MKLAFLNVFVFNYIKNTFLSDRYFTTIHSYAKSIVQAWQKTLLLFSAIIEKNTIQLNNVRYQSLATKRRLVKQTRYGMVSTPIAILSSHP